MSRCAGTGAEHSQTATLASGNMPYHRCSVQFMNGGWLGGRKASLSFWFSNLLLAESLNLFWAVNHSSGSEKNCM